MHERIHATRVGRAKAGSPREEWKSLPNYLLANMASLSRRSDPLAWRFEGSAHGRQHEAPEASNPALASRVSRVTVMAVGHRTRKPCSLFSPTQNY